MSDSGQKPSTPYWHLHVDENGVSHQTQCALTDYELKGVGPADPQWNDEMASSEATVVFTVQRSAGSETGMRTPPRNGSSCYRADGSSKAWTAPASSRAQATSRSARIRGALKLTAKRDTVRARSATNLVGS